MCIVDGGMIEHVRGWSEPPGNMPSGIWGDCEEWDCGYEFPPPGDFADCVGLCLVSVRVVKL